MPKAKSQLAEIGTSVLQRAKTLGDPAFLPGNSGRPHKRHGQAAPADDELRRLILTYANRHDVLTGFLNFASFQNELDQMLKRTPAGKEVATVWIDVLNLRREFALWGVEAAEALVRGVSNAMRGATDRDALIGRISGNCFAFALPVAKGDPVGRQRLQKVLDALLHLESTDLEAAPEVAAGVAFYPLDGDSAEDLLRYSSLAASRARYTHSSSILTFQPGMRMLLMRSHLLEVEIAKAIDRNELSMMFQPKVDLISGKVLGAEALMRWHHPEWGAVPPSEFIPIAERSTLIHRVFDFSLRSALENARRWTQLGIAPSVISVNVSAANLRREDFARHVRRVMAEVPIAPVELELEVTESLLLDDEELFAARMRQLKTIGVRLAIDDFGTRYTGFNLLKRLPLDTMKIDRCFIRGIHQSMDMRTLCSTIIAMARHMKLRTVAEGIEELEELDVMQQIGCDAGQGFLFQRPATPEDFISFLRGWPAMKTSLGFAGQSELCQADPLYGIA
ncbi:MAG TPA: bifunctional diguanylate cyclase/phosphodiesterase [Terracidiphilus sp.]|jgi:EAL domain-containing protein (putative c-di-GMP-specific phosphodiesterase class I)/GGDEF domain-containing protein